MQLLTAEQTAKQLQVKKTRVYEMARLGIIPCVRMGRQIRFEQRILEQWVNNGGSIEKINLDEIQSKDLNQSKGGKYER